MRRKERAPVLLEGIAAAIEVEVCVCNRCGARVLAQQTKAHAWVVVASDGRGGHHLDFCGPAHAAEYFRELVPPEEQGRPALAVVRPAPASANDAPVAG